MVKLSLKRDSSVLLMVPTLNEQLGLEKVLEDMPTGLGVLMVDGGSTDRTVDVAKQHRAKVIAQKFGKGKGCGVRTGMDYFPGTARDVLCMIDGDRSNDPGELPKMIEVPVNYRKRLGETKFSPSLRFRNFGYLVYYLLRSF